MMIFIVYFFLLIIVPFLAQHAANNASKKNVSVWRTPYIYLILIIYAYFVGMRDNIGVDYPEYYQIVKYGPSHYYYDTIEPLAKLTVYIVHYSGLPIYTWFILTTLIQVIFLIHAFRGENIKYLPWAMFFFPIFLLALYMNGIRQGIAISFFLCSIGCVSKKNWKEYLFYIIIGSLFHKSILLWLPIYFIDKLSWLSSLKKQILLLIILLISSSLLINSILSHADSLFQLLGYGHQHSIINASGDLKMGSGLGLIFKYLRWCLYICMFKFIYRNDSEKSVVICYKLLLIAFSFDYAVALNVMLSRTFIYLQFAEVFVFSHIVYHTLKDSNSSNRSFIGISLVLVSFIYCLLLLPRVGEWNIIN